MRKAKIHISHNYEIKCQDYDLLNPNYETKVKTTAY